MKNKILFLIFLLFSLSLNVFFADEVQNEFQPGYHEFIGDVELFKNYKTFQNSCFNPYMESSLLNDMTVDGVAPAAIVVVREATNFSFGNGNGRNFYNYSYYGFYGTFSDDKFVVSDDVHYQSIVDFGKLRESVYCKSNKFDSKINNFNGQIKRFNLKGYQIESNLYKQKHLKYEKDVDDFIVYQSGSFIYAYGGLSHDYIVFKPDTSSHIFFYPDNRPFLMGGLLPPMETQGSKELQVIPAMVNLAVVCLVGLLTLLIVLKVSLKVLRKFFPI